MFHAARLTFLQAFHYKHDQRDIESKVKTSKSKPQSDFSSFNTKVRGSITNYALTHNVFLENEFQNKILDRFKIVFGRVLYKNNISLFFKQ